MLICTDTWIPFIWCAHPTAPCILLRCLGSLCGVSLGTCETDVPFGKLRSWSLPPKVALLLPYLDCISIQDVNSQAMAQMFCDLGYLHHHHSGWIPAWLFCLWSSLLSVPGSSRWQLKDLGPRPPCERAWLSSRPLAFSWPSHWCWMYLGNEPADVRSVSVF